MYSVTLTMRQQMSQTTKYRQVKKRGTNKRGQRPTTNRKLQNRGTNKRDQPTEYRQVKKRGTNKRGQLPTTYRMLQNRRTEQDMCLRVIFSHFQKQGQEKLTQHHAKRAALKCSQTPL